MSLQGNDNIISWRCNISYGILMIKKNKFQNHIKILIQQCNNILSCLPCMPVSSRGHGSQGLPQALPTVAQHSLRSNRPPICCSHRPFLMLAQHAPLLVSKTHTSPVTVSRQNNISLLVSKTHTSPVTVSQQYNKHLIVTLTNQYVVFKIHTASHRQSTKLQTSHRYTYHYMSSAPEIVLLFYWLLELECL